MALSVATNVGALAATRAASAVNNSMETSMSRLASGKRINSASDDSAGLAIASRLTAESRGLDMAARNAADAQAMLDTIESAHAEVANILQRMRELAVQGANDTNGTADRSNIRLELTELSEEIDAIASQTKWAGNDLVDAANTFAFQVGDEGSETLTVITSVVAATGLAVEATAIADLTSSAKFSTFVNIANSAVATIASYRAEYGANSNRLDHIMSHLATSSESIKASLGRMEDADYATETTNLAKSQILQQAATSMLAQANASKQTILSLLQG
jgi:flagellin